MLKLLVSMHLLFLAVVYRVVVAQFQDYIVLPEEPLNLFSSLTIYNGLSECLGRTNFETIQQRHHVIPDFWIATADAVGYRCIQRLSEVKCGVRNYLLTLL